MPTQRQKVKGIKFGTLASYNQQTHDADMLYFITDKGLLYRGNSIVVPRNYTSYVKQDATPDNEEYVTFSVETYGNGGQQGDTLTFDVYSRTAVNNIVATLQAAIANHIAAIAASDRLGHVKLSDDTRDSTHNADYGLTHNEAFAATPAAVARALAQANEYTDQQIAAIAGAMLFKGTLGTADAYDPSASYAVGDYCTHGTGTSEKLYRCTTATTGTWNASHWTEVARTAKALPATHTVGWTYRIVAPDTYAGHSCEVGDLVICVASGTAANNEHWTVAQNNIDGAVTADADLDADAIILGNGGKTVKKMAAGLYGQIVRIGPNGPEWHNLEPFDIGISYGEAILQAGVRYDVAALTNMPARDGGIIAVTCPTGLAASAKIKANQLGSFQDVKFRGAAITEGLVAAGDTATMVYDATASCWNIVAIDRQAPASLQGFANDLIMRGTCNTAEATTTKVADIAANSAQGMLVAISFTASVPAGATLKLSSAEAAAHAIMHRGAAIAANAIRSGDTATLVYDASSGTGLWHLLAIDRPFDSAPTSGSHNLVDSDAVYQAIDNATLYWEEM